MKKIKIPDGMLAAALAGVQKYNFSSNGTKVLSWGQMDAISSAFEAALLWLADNPIVPTDEQIESIEKALTNSVGAHTEGVWDGRRELLREWQRRMFLAPEEPNPVVQRVKFALRGLTLTVGEAAELMDEIQRCTPPSAKEQTPEQKRDYDKWIANYKAPSGAQMGDS